MEWTNTTYGSTVSWGLGLPFSSEYMFGARVRNIAGRWSLELWREHMGRWDWEFVERFNDLEDAMVLVQTDFRFDYTQQMREALAEAP